MGQNPKELPKAHSHAHAKTIILWKTTTVKRKQSYQSPKLRDISVDSSLTSGTFAVRLTKIEDPSPDLLHLIMSGSSFYDELVVKSEDFRAGFPDLPKLPMEMKAPSVDKERIDAWNRCISKAAVIVQQAGLDYNEIYIIMVKGKHGAVFHPTLIIRVSNSDEKALWQPLYQRIE